MCFVISFNAKISGWTDSHPSMKKTNIVVSSSPAILPPPPTPSQEKKKMEWNYHIAPLIIHLIDSDALSGPDGCYDWNKKGDGRGHCGIQGSSVYKKCDER